ncbi:MAG TPA: RagB/SusD family nutrient uptake outer membrane protein [Longimicrobiales bacterium]|nr:RagB/SusD family nutrient uptake outer membrane protein [Longimicrobiales bacterium]
MTNSKRTIRRAALALGLLPLAACSLDVTNPGPINDSALHTPQAVPPIVAGANYNMSRMMNTSLEVVSLVSGELSHSGSYPNEGLYARGILRPEDVDGIWGSVHRARWTAEDATAKLRDLLGDDYGSSSDAARANLYAGIGNRTSGELLCEAVIDGGAPQARTVHFERADTFFARAASIAAASGDDDVVAAAHGGRAAVLAWLGKWDQAVQEAALVPTNFVYTAAFSDAHSDTQNDLWYETHSRAEYTVANTLFADAHGDPRTPWDTIYAGSGKPAVGPNGTVVLRQKKYDDGSASVPVVQGTEARLIQAEAALRSGNVAGAMTFINQARAAYGLAALAAPANADEAWITLERERGATTWLQARRLWDLSRWMEAKRPMDPRLVHFLVPTDGSGARALCVPIGRDEANSNPNIP